jgi:hypothetical protein
MRAIITYNFPSSHTGKGNMPMSKNKVFISYPSESFDLASLLVDRLRNENIEVWFDQVHIRASQNISDRIRAGLEESICCIFVLSTYSLESKWCHAEVGAFWGSGKPIVIYPTQPRCEVPSYLSGIRVANDLSEMVFAIKQIMQESVIAADDVALDTATLIKGGLTRAFRIPTDNPSRLKRVCELIDQEVEGKKKLRLMASSGHSYLSPAGPVWKAGLGQLIAGGVVDMTVVLESPFSPFAVTRALANRVRHHQWEEKQVPDDLIELLQYPNISIWVTEQVTTCSLFFTSQAVYYDPYLWALPDAPGRTENNFWVFEFDRAGEPEYDCYTLLEKHFSFLLSHSIPLEQVLHTPEQGSPIPKGKDFYNLFKNTPEVALNRYEKLTEEFRRTMTKRYRGGK